MFSVLLIIDSWQVMSLILRATSHTRLRARDHYTSSTPLVEKAEPVQVHFTLRSSDQRSMWIQDACKVYMHGFLHGIKWIVFHGHLDSFQKPPLEGRSNTKPGDHDTPNAHNRRFILFDHVWGPHMNRNSLKLHLDEGMVTYDFTLHLRTRDHMTWFWRCLAWDSLCTFSFGLSQFSR
jgi:hypothetical protein